MPEYTPKHGRPIDELLKEREEKRKSQNIQSPQSGGGSGAGAWDQMMEYAKSKMPVAPQSSSASNMSSPKAKSSVKVEDSEKLFNKNFQPKFEAALGKDYSREALSFVEHAINGNYDNYQKNPDVKQLKNISWDIAKAVVAMADNKNPTNPTQRDAYNAAVNKYNSLIGDYKQLNTLFTNISNKYSKNDMKNNAVFNQTTGKFMDRKEFEKINNEPYTLSQGVVGDINAKKINEDGDLTTSIENKYAFVYYYKHEGIKQGVRNESLKILDPVVNSWNTFAFNNISKSENEDVKQLSFNMIESELKFISKNGTVGNLRKQDIENATKHLNALQGLSNQDKRKYIENKKNSISDITSRMGYYGKVTIVNSYRDKIANTGSGWYNEISDTNERKKLFNNIQKGGLLDDYRGRLQSVIDLEKNTRKKVLEVMETNWKDNAVKYGYDSGFINSKEKNQRLLNNLISVNSKGELNINSFEKFFNNYLSVGKKNSFGLPIEIPSGNPWGMTQENFDRRTLIETKNKLKPIYNGMVKAFKKSYDDKKVTDKFKTDISVPLQMKGVDFRINLKNDGSLTFEGNTNNQTKYENLVSPLLSLLQDSNGKITNDNAVLFSNKEVNEGLYAVQKTEFDNRRNFKTADSYNEKEDGVWRSSTIENSKTTRSEVDNKTILANFYNNLKEPDHINITYLKQTNIPKHVAFLFSGIDKNGEEIKMQMIVPQSKLEKLKKETKQKILLYESSKNTISERMFINNGYESNLLVESNALNKRVVSNANISQPKLIRDSEDGKYKVKFNTIINGNIESKVVDLGLYFNYHSLKEAEKLAYSYFDKLKSFE